MPAYKWLFLVHGGKTKIMHIVRKTQRFHIKSILQKTKKKFFPLWMCHICFLLPLALRLMKFKFSFPAERSSIGRNSKNEWSHVISEKASIQLHTSNVSARKTLECQAREVTESHGKFQLLLNY